MGTSEMGDPPGTRLTWREVYRGLPGDEARSAALAGLKSLKLGPSNFGMQKARVSVVEHLVRFEDEVEATVRRADRMQVRQVRRALECEIWP